MPDLEKSLSLNPSINIVINGALVPMFVGFLELWEVHLVLTTEDQGQGKVGKNMMRCTYRTILSFPEVLDKTGDTVLLQCIKLANTISN